MEIVVQVPESASVPAADFLETAAGHWGWHESQGITAEEYVLDRFEEQLHAHWRAGQRTLSRDEAAAELPVPESRGIRAHRDREEAREAAELARQGEGTGQAQPGSGANR